MALWRTVSGQTLAPMANVEEDEADRSTLAAWRPDGRVVATTVGTSIHLNVVEELLQSRDDDTETSASASTMLRRVDLSSPIHALHWAHAGRPHPKWKEIEKDDEVCWNQYQVPFLDGQHLLLEKGMSAEVDTTTVPNSTTPLSILYVITVDDTSKQFQLHAYLHGCYPVLVSQDVPLLGNGDCSTATLSMTTSTNLAHFCVHSSNSNRLILYSMPQLAVGWQWQYLSTLYSSVQSQLSLMEHNVYEIQESWKSSIRPLDLKLQGLIKLLEQYGLLNKEGNARYTNSNSLPTLLVQYTLMGATRSAPNLSNAMDQFFTGVQMNDQLLTRMERSLTTAVAHVEDRIVETLVRPAVLLVQAAGALVQLAEQPVDFSDDESSTPQLSTSASHNLLHMTQRLHTQATRIFAHLVEARMRLTDLVAWLRATGAHVKARGTAAHSARRDQAQQLRVTESLQKRVLGYWEQQPTMQASTTSISPTEELLNVPFVRLLQHDDDDEESQVRRIPCVPILQNGTIPTSTTVPSLTTTLQHTRTAATAAFVPPPDYWTIACVPISLPDCNGGLVATTTRQGRGGLSNLALSGTALPRGFYSGVNGEAHFQWLVVAQVQSTSCTRIRLYALPLSWDGATLQTNVVVWTGTLELPDTNTATIEELQFYGNDGKSTLAKHSSGEEGEQTPSIAVIVRNVETKQQTLWLIPYNDLALTAVEVERTADGKLEFPENNSTTIQVRADGIEEGEDGIAFARTRRLNIEGQITSLVLSGARGMAAVVATGTDGSTSLDLFDLEDDEDEDDEEEDMEV